MHADLEESRNLAKKHPERVAALKKQYDAWLDEMAEPASAQQKRWRPGLEPRPKNSVNRERRRAAREARRKSAR